MEINLAEIEYIPKEKRDKELSPEQRMTNNDIAISKIGAEISRVKTNFLKNGGTLKELHEIEDAVDPKMQYQRYKEKHGII